MPKLTKGTKILKEKLHLIKKDKNITHNTRNQDGTKI